MLLEWRSKIDITQLKLSKANEFPVRVYDSKYLEKAFENFDYEPVKAKVYLVILVRLIGFECC